MTIPEAIATAVKYHQAGQLDRAEPIYREVLQADPNQADALHLLGLIAQQNGQIETAIDYISRAIASNPNLPQAHFNLGNVLRRQGKAEEAAANYRRAVEIKPDYVNAHHNLGSMLQEQGAFDQAVAAYSRALEIVPDHAEVHNNLGSAFLGQGRLEEALASYRRAIEVKPRYAQAHNNLGVALKELGKLDEAVTCYRSALQIEPGYPEAHNNLGNALRDQGKLAEATHCYQQAISFNPDGAEAHGNLAKAFEEQGDLDRAAESYRRALQIGLDRPMWRLRADVLCPAVFQSNCEIDEYRRRLLQRLYRFAETDLRIDRAEISISGSEPPFNLMYHGRNDRPIKEAYADMFRNCFAEETPGGRNGISRIGFVVNNRHEGIFLRFMRGVLERLDTTSFEVTVICSRAGAARIRGEIENESVRVLAVPDRFDQIVGAIRAARFDLLYYWEIGTDTTSYFLPFFRLAPVQCTSWGVPVTSGIPQIDYFVSSELLEPEGIEPEDAAEHYSEKLVRLKTLPSYYYRPRLPAPLQSRDRFGLLDGRHVYLCPQNLLKLHPDYDHLLGEILRRDPAGQLVLLEGRCARWTESLRERFRVTIPDCIGRIKFLPLMSRPRFLNLLAIADVLLDPLHFGGGSTVYEAAAVGTPLVTLPTAYMRGRITYASYRKTGVPDCVASSPKEYVDIAVRLATDREYRETVRSKILAASEVLLEDDEAVGEFERFFRQAISRTSGRN